MGWGHCGQDGKGREIGYLIDAVCDHKGCDEEIDRGLAYACGGMHGNETLPLVDIEVCERYFCPSHLYSVVSKSRGGEALSVCSDCRGSFPEEEE